MVRQAAVVSLPIASGERSDPANRTQERVGGGYIQWLIELSTQYLDMEDSGLEHQLQSKVPNVAVGIPMGPSMAIQEVEGKWSYGDRRLPGYFRKACDC